MASKPETADDAGIVFVHEDDSSITAVDLEMGVARGGSTRSEALTLLAEALELHEGRGEPIDDPEAFLRDELGLTPEAVAAPPKDLPEFLQ